MIAIWGDLGEGGFVQILRYTGLLVAIVIILSAVVCALQRAIRNQSDVRYSPLETLDLDEDEFSQGFRTEEAPNPRSGVFSKSRTLLQPVEAPSTSRGSRTRPKTVRKW